MEHFFNVIKVFIEKHLIPTILSVVLAVFTILLFPSLISIQIKIGQPLFWLFVFFIWYLIIHVCICFVKKIKHKIWLDEHKEKLNNEAVTNLNALYDRLSKSDKNIILTFILNNNLPLKVREVDTFNCVLRSHQGLFNISKSLGDKLSGKNEYWYLPEYDFASSIGNHSWDNDFFLYKLKENPYHDFKLLFEQQGKLGNF